MPHLQHLFLGHSQFLWVPGFKLIQDLHFQGWPDRSGAGGRVVGVPRLKVMVCLLLSEVGGAP